MTRDILVDPFPPVSLCDTVETPPPECHVLFEWPLICKDHILDTYTDPPRGGGGHLALTWHF